MNQTTNYQSSCLESRDRKKAHIQVFLVPHLGAESWVLAGNSFVRSGFRIAAVKCDEIPNFEKEAEKFLRSGQSDQFLRELLGHQGVHHEFFVATEQGWLPVAWQEHEQAYAVIIFDLDDEGRIGMSRCAVDSGGKCMPVIMRLSDRLIVDVEGKRVMQLASEKAWNLVRNVLGEIVRNLRYGQLQDEALKKLFFEKTDYFIPLSRKIYVLAQNLSKAFDTIYLPSEFHIGDTKIPYKPVIVRCMGNEVVAHAIAPQRSVVVISSDGGEYVRIYPQWMMLDKLYEHYATFFLRVWRGEYGLGIKVSAKRQSMIYKSLCMLLRSVSAAAAKKIIQQSSRQLWEVARKSQKRAEIKEYFERFVHNIDQSMHELFIHEKSWYQIDHDYRRAWMPIALIDEIFDKSQCNFENELHFVVPTKLFRTHLVKFQQLLAQHQIPLTWDGKTVQTVALDIDIDATRAYAQDWFHLAPQIRADGILLSDEQREILFARDDGTIDSSADCIRFLDEKSQEVLRVLAKILQLEGKSVGKGKSHDIIRLPRLRILDLLELRASGARVTLSPEDEGLIERLAHFKRIPRLALPEKFKGTLRNYQQEGYWWLAFLYNHYFGACLADDMGLGKTVQVIAFLAGIAEGIIHRAAQNIPAPHLIVVPPTLVFNWQSEIAKFYPALRVKELMRGDSAENLMDYDIILTTYDRVRLDIDHLKDMSFHVLVLDEAQAIKNIHSGRSAAIRQLRSAFTVVLTGTPLENHIGEYYSIIDIALPGLLPTYKKFMEYVRKDNQNPLIQKTRPFVLRRMKQLILKELPTKVESDVFLNMDEKQQAIYATTVAEVKRSIEHAYATHTAAQARIIALTAILRLRQLCISPKLVDTNYDGGSPKIVHLTDSLQELVQEGHAVLVFSQFTSCLDLVEQGLQQAELGYYRIDGTTSMARRKKIVADFQEEGGMPAILLLSLKTGGVGLNLTRANYIFHVDPWWNPAVENQASDRAHRIGQKNTVFVTRLLMHHTIEEKMMLLKEQKLKLFQAVVDYAENKNVTISKKDLDLLLL